MPDVLETEMEAVIQALERERTLEEQLAASRADTGKALLRLEEACRGAGVKREVCITRLREKAALFGLEELTTVTAHDRTRLAHFREIHSPETTRTCLRLGPTKMRLIDSLSPARLEEFVGQGVPTSEGEVWVSQVKVRELRQAVKVAGVVPEGEPITPDLLTPPKMDKPNPFDRILKQVYQLKELTLDQTQELLLLLVRLLADTPSRETRRQRENEIEMNSVADEVQRSLDEIWQMVEFGPGLDPMESRARACAAMSRILIIVSRWTRPERGIG